MVEKAKLSQFERVVDWSAMDLSKLRSDLELAKKTPRSATATAAILSPPLSPAAMDDEDRALQRWRDAEKRAADFESEIEVVQTRRSSRRAAKPAHAATAAAEDEADAQRIATLQREHSNARKEVELAQAALASVAKAKKSKGEHRKASPRKSPGEKRSPRDKKHRESHERGSRSPSPPPPASDSPAAVAAASSSYVSAEKLKRSPVRSALATSPPRSAKHANDNESSSSSPPPQPRTPSRRSSSAAVNTSVPSPPSGELRSVAEVVRDARAGDTSTMAAKRDVLQAAVLQRRKDLAGGSDTMTFN